MMPSNISHFEIIESIGAGGMGVVYKALDKKLNRSVAIKSLANHLSHNPDFRKRFLIEAQAAASLNHPNITTIYETIELDNDAFIVMEFIEGEDLSKKITRTGLDIKQALDYVIQIAEGLKEAHSKGIVHRDIKCANIIVTNNGLLKIMDFGLAKIAGQSMMTQLGTTIGTINYMSPEQARGDEIDFRTDLWALGIILYELLAGRLPFKGEYEQAVIYSILNEKPKSILGFNNKIPAELDDIINRLLSKLPDERYLSTDDLLQDLKIIKQSTDTGIPVSHLRTGLGTAEYISNINAEKKSSSVFMNKRIVAISSVVVLFFIIIFLQRGSILKLFGSGLVPEERHLAVLPFDFIGNDTTSQIFCNGLVETISSQLSQFEQFEGALWVVPSSEIRKGKIETADDAHKKFNVNLVLTGSVQKMNQGYRLALNLIDAENKRQLASRIIDDPMTNNSYLQDEAIVKVADMLNIELKPENLKVLLSGKTSSAEAYELYLKGKGYLLNFDNMNNVNTAIEYFDNAIKKDTLFALAFAGLGEANLYKYMKTKEISFIESSIRSCTKANQLDDRLLQGRLTLGSVYIELGKYNDAKEQFQKVLEIDPRNSEAYYGKANALVSLGHSSEAEASYKKAIEMKPSYWAGYNWFGIFYWRQGKFHEAAAQFQHVITLTPNNSLGYSNLGWMYSNLNMNDKAIEMFKKSLTLQKDYRTYSYIAAIYFQMGNYVEAARQYENVLKLNMNDYNMWGYLATCYYWIPAEKYKAQDAVKKALSLSEPQLKINPNNIRLLLDIASFYGMLKDQKKTFSLLKRIELLHPEDVYDLFYVGDIYEEWLNDRKNALKWMKAAIEKGYSVKNIEQLPGLKNLVADSRFKQLSKFATN